MEETQWKGLSRVLRYARVACPTCFLHFSTQRIYHGLSTDWVEILAQATNSVMLVWRKVSSQPWSAGKDALSMLVDPHRCSPTGRSRTGQDAKVPTWWTVRTWMRGRTCANLQRTWKLLYYGTRAGSCPREVKYAQPASVNIRNLCELSCWSSYCWIRPSGPTTRILKNLECAWLTFFAFSTSTPLLPP